MVRTNALMLNRSGDLYMREVPAQIKTLDTTPYVELHAHSNYSMLEGASSIEELVWKARQQGHVALALTDHNGMFGSMEFARTAKEAGLQPITGLELTVLDAKYSDLQFEDRFADIHRHTKQVQRNRRETIQSKKARAGSSGRSHVTLLAETKHGYANLCRLSSIAFGLNEESEIAKQQKRIDPCVPIEELKAHSQGVILLTGCREGVLAQLIEDGHLQQSESVLRQFVQWFGHENVFVELQDNLVYGDQARNRSLLTIAERIGVRVVGTGNVHYHDRDRHRLQDVMVAIRHRKSLDESHQERRPNAEFYLRTPEEQMQRFRAYHSDAAANSVHIAQRCTFDLTEDLGYRLPAPKIKSGQTPAEELATICIRQLNERYATATDHIREIATSRLKYELRLIEANGLAGFFLVYHQIFHLAAEVEAEIRGTVTPQHATTPPGRGRGSSVASITCYLIGLSHIDPIKSNLTIDRFLNDDMHTFPDIDLDFPRDIRNKLIERIYQAWGKEHAALVAAFTTYRIKSAVRDVGKALGLSVTELKRLSKKIAPPSRINQLSEELTYQSDFVDLAQTKDWQHLVELARELDGFPRHLSQHPGGMVISSEPLINYVPCQPAAWPNRYLCHWDKDSISDAKMIKIDFLSLGMLSVVDEVVNLAAEHGYRPIDLSRIAFNDSHVYDAICRGDTIGVFQIESRAQIAMLPRTQPRTLEDLTVQVSIVRPGPIVGKAVNPYIQEREKQRRLDESYTPPSVHACVDEVLSETLGVVLFQEQVIQVARQMGGFTVSQAEQFRRAMGRKQSFEAIKRYEQKFMDGAHERDVPKAIATRMFQNLLGFAKFGFPKSHGAAFGLLAYQTAWLKQYYPVPFFCALFNNQPVGFYPPHVLINDAKRHKIEVKRPDINISRTRCTIEASQHDAPSIWHADETVRIGLGYVHGISEQIANYIESQRSIDGRFVSLFDFVQRTGINRKSVQNLIRIGAFDSLGLNRRELIWQLGLFGSNPDRGKSKIQQQLRLPLPTVQDQIQLKDFTNYQRIRADYELLSLSPDGHPMQFLRTSLGENVASSHHLHSMPNNTYVEVAGLVVCRQRPTTASGIIFLLLEDEFGLINILVSKKLSERFHNQVHTDPFILVEGILEQRSVEQQTLVATHLKALTLREDFHAPEGKFWR